jgi:hypothetical protein
MVAHAGTVIDRDAALRIDEDPEKSRTRRFEVHELVSEPFQGRSNPLLTPRFRFHKQKMGVTAHLHFETLKL